MFFLSSSGLTTRRILQHGALPLAYSIPVRPSVQPIAYIISARFNSGSTKPAAKPARPASSSKRPLLQRRAKVTKVGDESASKEWPSSNSLDSWPNTHGRIPLLWPSVWSLLAVAGIYGTLAYLDVKAGIPSSDGSQLPERTTLSRSWYLTPTVVSEGIKATWNELDGITIGIILANTAMCLPPIRKLLGRSGLPGLRPFQLAQHSWSYGAKQAVKEGLLLVLFLPGVVHYFDGDLFHIAAFVISVPLITSNLSKFAVRFNFIPDVSMTLGPHYSNYAIFGVYCVAYATERMWAPHTLIFRLEPSSLLQALVFWYGYFLTRGSALARHASFVSIGLPALIEHMLTASRRFWSVLCLAAHMPYAT